MGICGILICSGFSGAGVAVSSILVRRVLRSRRRVSKEDTDNKKRKRITQYEIQPEKVEQQSPKKTSILEYTPHSSQVCVESWDTDHEFRNRWIGEDIEVDETEFPEETVLSNFVSHSSNREKRKSVIGFSVSKFIFDEECATKTTTDKDITSQKPSISSSSILAKPSFQLITRDKQSTTVINRQESVAEGISRAELRKPVDGICHVPSSILESKMDSSKIVSEGSEAIPTVIKSYHGSKTSNSNVLDKIETPVEFTTHSSAKSAENALCFDYCHDFLLPPNVPSEFAISDGYTEETETASLTPDDYPSDFEDELTSEDRYHGSGYDEEYTEDNIEDQDQDDNSKNLGSTVPTNPFSQISYNKSVTFSPYPSQIDDDDDIVHKYKPESPVFGSQLYSNSPSSKSPAVSVWRQERDSKMLKCENSPLIGVLQPPLITRKPTPANLWYKQNELSITQRERANEEETMTMEDNDLQPHGNIDSTLGEKTPNATVTSEVRTMTTCEATALADHLDETPSLCIEMPSMTTCSASLIEGPDAIISSLKPAQSDQALAYTGVDIEEIDAMVTDGILKQSSDNTQNPETANINIPNNEVPVRDLTKNGIDITLTDATKEIEALESKTDKNEEIEVARSKPPETNCPCMDIKSSPNILSKPVEHHQHAETEKENPPKIQKAIKSYAESVHQRQEGRRIFGMTRRNSRLRIERNSISLSRLGEKIKSLPRRRKSVVEN